MKYTALDYLKIINIMFKKLIPILFIVFSSSFSGICSELYCVSFVNHFSSNERHLEVREQTGYSRVYGLKTTNDNVKEVLVGSLMFIFMSSIEGFVKEKVNCDYFSNAVSIVCRTVGYMSLGFVII